MGRLLLALQCFFLVLLAGRLPGAAARLLPAPPPDEKPPLPGPGPSPTPAPVVDDTREADLAEARRDGAVAMLGLLQRDGRLLDFLQEGIDGYADAQVGAAVRDIHRGCKKALGEHLRIEPVLPDPDNARVTVQAGFDPARIKLVGQVLGQPPFAGTLRHPGWRAAEVRLPATGAAQDRSVIAPAEVEL